MTYHFIPKPHWYMAIQTNHTTLYALPELPSLTSLQSMLPSDQHNCLQLILNIMFPISVAERKDGMDSSTGDFDEESTKQRTSKSEKEVTVCKKRSVAGFL